MGDAAEVKQVVEGLWAGGKAEVERIEAEARERTEAAEHRVRELRTEIAEADNAAAEARAEMEALPDRLPKLQIEGREDEILAVQGEYAELRTKVEGAEERARSAQTELADLTGGADPEEYLSGVRAEAEREAEAARYEFECNVKREFEELREALEVAREAAIGPLLRERREAERAAFEANRRRVEANRERERQEALRKRAERAREMGINPALLVS